MTKQTAIRGELSIRPVSLYGGADPNVGKLLTVADLAERQVYEGHTAPVTAIAISHDGKTVATGSSDHSIKLHDACGRRGPPLR